MKVHNRAGQALRQASQSCARSHSLFGAFYRARAARSSAAEATVATAHTIARVIYHMLTQHEAFQPESIQAFDQRRQQREVKYLQKKAKTLGFTLQPATA
jgi:transposase